MKHEKILKLSRKVQLKEKKPKTLALFVSLTVM